MVAYNERIWHAQCMLHLLSDCQHSVQRLRTILYDVQQQP